MTTPPTSTRLLVLQPPVPASVVRLEDALGPAARSASDARTVYAADAAALVRAAAADDDGAAARALVTSASTYRREFTELVRARVFDEGHARTRRRALLFFEYRLALVRPLAGSGAPPSTFVRDTSLLVEGAAIVYALIAALQRLAAAPSTERALGRRSLLHAIALTHTLEREWLASFAPLVPPRRAPELRECVLVSPLLARTVREALLGAYYVAEAAAARPRLDEATLLLRAASSFATAAELAPGTPALDACRARATAHAYRRVARTLLDTHAGQPEWAAGVAVACADEALALARAHGDTTTLAAAEAYAVSAHAENEHVRGNQAVPTALVLTFERGPLRVERGERRDAARLVLPLVDAATYAWDADALAARLDAERAMEAARAAEARTYPAVPTAVPADDDEADTGDAPEYVDDDAEGAGRGDDSLRALAV
jgi:hypothetical protein